MLDKSENALSCIWWRQLAPICAIVKRIGKSLGLSQLVLNPNFYVNSINREDSRTAQSWSKTASHQTFRVLDTRKCCNHAYIRLSESVLFTVIRERWWIIYKISRLVWVSMEIVSNTIKSSLANLYLFHRWMRVRYYTSVVWSSHVNIFVNFIRSSPSSCS